MGEASARERRGWRQLVLGETARQVIACAALVSIGIAIGGRTLASAPPALLGESLKDLQHELIGHDKDCKSLTFTNETLKLIHEAPFLRYFHLSADVEISTGDVLKTFEASDVARRDTRVRQNGKAHAAGRGGSYETFVVFDNARAIARMSSLLGGADPIKPVLLEYPGDDGSPSQFEGLAYNSHLDTFYVVRESAEHDDGVLVAHVYDVKLPAGDEPSQVVQIVAGPCDTEQEFSSANKGFEGADWLPVKGANAQGGYLLGLCEGNQCEGGKVGREPGYGRVVVMEKVTRDNGGCTWRTAATLSLPKSLKFMDYSAISIRPTFDGSDDWAVAVSSQENAAVWLGRLKLNLGAKHTGAPVDPDRFEFSKGRVYDFPRDNDCRRVYCNIEGVAWHGEDKLVAASDQMKDGGRQDYRCWDKDQSVHLFLIPTDDILGDKL